jgi:hypothetical protein
VEPQYERRLDWTDVLLAAEGHPDPAGWLAGQMGVTRETGLSYLRAVKPGARSYSLQPTTGQTAPRAAGMIARLQAQADRDAEAAAREAGQRARRRAIARVLRGITEVDIGEVAIKETSGPRTGGTGTRTVGTIDVDLADVAAAVEHGAWSLAEDRMSETFMDAYGDGLGAVLDITDYPDGITWS